MRYPASEKLEIIQLVERSHLPAKQTLDMLGVPRTTFYRWYERYRLEGLQALKDKAPLPARVSLSLVLTAAVSCTPTEDSGGASESGLSGSDAAFVADTAEYFDRLEQLGFAGGLLVARGGETLLHAGYDMADREAGRPWSVNTISTVGSITKQFTGAAILLLQEDGLLSVEDSITEYFPDVPGALSPAKRINRATLCRP